jgi:hypothetical protein
MEQMSMLVGVLFDKLDAIQASFDEDKVKRDSGRFAKQEEVSRAENRLDRKREQSTEADRRVLDSVFNESERDLARKGESWAVMSLLRAFGDRSPAAQDDPPEEEMKPGDKVRLKLWGAASAIGTLLMGRDGKLQLKVEQAEGIDPKTLKGLIPVEDEPLERVT